MKNLICLLISILVLMISCTATKTTRYTIASQNADCVGVTPQKCLLVKIGNATAWQLFYSNIEGFNYEPGYEYTLEVKQEKYRHTPMDASSVRYTLVKEISRVEKTSGDLPEALNRQQNGIQCTGKVLVIESENIGKGAAAGKFEVSVVKIQVTGSANEKIKEGNTIYCELIANPRVIPIIGREYVFRAKSLHPAHAKGVYLLETDVLDLTR